MRNEDTLPEVIDVEYHLKHTMHVFTSANSAGLVHIDSTDREDAYNRIGPVLSRHFSAALGRQVRYVPTTNYSGFVEALAGRGTHNVPHLAFCLEHTGVQA